MKLFSTFDVAMLAAAALFFAFGLNRCCAAGYTSENPEYVKQWDAAPGGFFVVLSQTNCGPCHVLAKRLRDAAIPHIVVEIDKQPLTAALFPKPAQTPTVYWMMPKRFKDGIAYRDSKRLTIWMTDP
jgi:hypothetical protein